MPVNKIRRHPSTYTQPTQGAGEWAWFEVVDGDVVYDYDASNSRRLGRGGFLNVEGATLTVTRAAHEGRVIGLNRAAGVTVTLPAATGSGDRYTFVVVTAPTSNQHRINVTGNDAYFGNAVVAQDGGDTVVMFEAGADADQINMNGTTTGGTKGASVVLVDMALDSWHVFIQTAASGIEATPFSTGQIS